jgi:hypothetical protein
LIETRDQSSNFRERRLGEFADLVAARGPAPAAGATAAVVLALAAPAHPATSATAGATVASRTAGSAVVATEQGRYRLQALGPVSHAGWTTNAYRARIPGARDDGRPATRPLGAVARLNNGRLPIGLVAPSGSVPVSYAASRTLTVWLDTRTDLVIDLSWVERVTTTAHSGAASFPLAEVASTRTGLPSAAVREAVAAARDEHASLDRRGLLRSLAALCAVLGGSALLAAAGFLLAARRRVQVVAPAPEPVREPAIR